MLHPQPALLWDRVGASPRWSPVLVQEPTSPKRANGFLPGGAAHSIHTWDKLKQFPSSFPRKTGIFSSTNLNQMAPRRSRAVGVSTREAFALASHFEMETSHFQGAELGFGFVSRAISSSKLHQVLPFGMKLWRRRWQPCLQVGLCSRWD